MEEKFILQRFIEWTKLKIRLHINVNEPVYFREGEIWWTSLGMNIGFEQDGKHETFERPALVLKKFGKNILWVLPMTSKQKTGKHYYRLTYKGKNSFILLSQLRMISSKRLLRKIWTLSKSDFVEVKKCIKNFL